MSSTLLRSGLWIIILVMVAWVLHESYEGLPASEFFAPAMLQKGLLVGVLILISGLLVRMFEKGAKVVSKNRGKVCGTPIVRVAFYSRAHLRSVLHKDD